MGVCTSRPWRERRASVLPPPETDDSAEKKSPFAWLTNASPFKGSPMVFFKPPSSPARHIKAVMRKVGGKSDDFGDDDMAGFGMDKVFGLSRGLEKKYEIGEEIGRGHFGHTCKGKLKKKGDVLGEKEVAVKVIPKAKMTTAIAIDDVRREVMILKALSGHNNLVQFYDAFEDNDNVYMVMELCEGGELLERILSRGGKYTEDDAKAVLSQILNAVAFCHLQGVVHRDLKPENFLFSTKDENSSLKAIDFGLSDFVKPDEQLNDIVGSAYYVAPEVLQRSYSTEADVWSIGVIAYILLCGSRPFWARTESGIFNAVLKAEPSFEVAPWPSISPEAQDFVKGLLNKNPQKRLTAAGALCHPWFKDKIEGDVLLDIHIVKLMKAYLNSSALRKASLQALAKTLTEDELYYLKEQFALLEPSKDGSINLENIKVVLTKNATEAMNESCVFEFLESKDGFCEFCAATLSVHQLEAQGQWEAQARHAYDVFEKYGNRPIVIEELASELGLSMTIPVHVVLHDWIRHTDGKLSFLGFIKLLHGISVQAEHGQTYH